MDFLSNPETADDFIAIDQCSDGFFMTGENGVRSIFKTGDGKVEFISFEDSMLAYVLSSMGYPAYYSVHPVGLQKPVKAVLMDLDGMTVRSEEFWIWIIQKTTASLLDNSKFELEDSDIPFVSGHSVSEHLKYCIDKYCPDKSIEDARKYYFKHTHFEIKTRSSGNDRGQWGC